MAPSRRSPGGGAAGGGAATLSAAGASAIASGDADAASSAGPSPSGTSRGQTMAPWDKKKRGGLSPPPPPLKASWEDLEATKGRAALVLDRVEFLGRSASLFTDLKVREAQDMERVVRTRSHPSLHLFRSLGRSKDQAVRLLEDQGELLRSKETASKRHDALSRFVFKEELRKSGKVAVERAKTSARGKPPARDGQRYPSYQDLFNSTFQADGGRREAPMMAVKCAMPYRMPDCAQPRPPRRRAPAV